MRPGTPQYRHWQGVGYVKMQEAKRRATNSRFQGNYVSPRKNDDKIFKPIGCASVGGAIGLAVGGPLGGIIGSFIGAFIGSD